MKAVILAGGLGTRISEETNLKPKRPKKPSRRSVGIGPGALENLVIGDG
jgi:hypothetical protein